MSNNIRAIAAFNKKYSTINREERNFCAILYHLLHLDGNLRKFLRKIGCAEGRDSCFQIKPDEAGVYFEYAFMRDIWNGLKNEEKRAVILELVFGSEKPSWADENPQKFNGRFVQQNPSKDKINSPGKWDISKLGAGSLDAKQRKNACELKYAFNIKPDMVIHTSLGAAVCIEAKFLSGGAAYPGGKGGSISQVQAQTKMMGFLGIHSWHVLISKEGPSSGTPEGYHSHVGWKEIFELLAEPENGRGVNELIRAYIAENKHLNSGQ